MLDNNLVKTKQMAANQQVYKQEEVNDYSREIHENTEENSVYSDNTEIIKKLNAKTVNLNEGISEDFLPEEQKEKTDMQEQTENILENEAFKVNLISTEEQQARNAVAEETMKKLRDSLIQKKGKGGKTKSIHRERITIDGSEDFGRRIYLISEYLKEDNKDSSSALYENFKTSFSAFQNAINRFSTDTTEEIPERVAAFRAAYDTAEKYYNSRKGVLFSPLSTKGKNRLDFAAEGLKALDEYLNNSAEEFKAALINRGLADMIKPVQKKEEPEYTEKSVAYEGNEKVVHLSKNRKAIMETAEREYEAASNEMTGEFFVKMNGYVDSGKAFEGESSYQDILVKMKKYITSGSRDTQRKLSGEIRFELEKFWGSLARRKSKVEDRSDYHKKVEYEYLAKLENEVKKLKLSMEEFQDGSLFTFQDEIPLSEEPSNIMSRKVGAWVSRGTEPLFPHAPSPSDVKQSLLLNNCFMLSSLAGIVASKPDYIRESMKDNKDGTVTVRFYNNEGLPHYVRVKKTTRSFGVDLYASSSTWVQILEKAYVVFCNTYKAEHETNEVKKKKYKNGYYAIDFGQPDVFLTDFMGEKYDVSANDALFGGSIFDIQKERRESVRRDGAFKADYTEADNEMYSYYKKYLGENKPLITGTVISNSFKEKKNFVLDHGIRLGHAYSVIGVTEKKGKKYVILKDPFSTFMPEYDKDGLLKEVSVGGQAISSMFAAGNKNMGVFELELKDYRAMFNYITGMKEEALNELTALMKKHVKEPVGVGVEKTVNNDVQNLDGFEELDVSELEGYKKKNDKKVSKTEETDKKEVVNGYNDSDGDDF